MSTDAAAALPTASPAVTPLTSDAGVAWSVRALEGEVPDSHRHLLTSPLAARVPGEVHTDLLAAGEVPDPFDADNEALLAWIGRTTWVYRATFAWSRDGHRVQELALDGLDTLAVVRLNGVELGRTANQHRSHRFDVSTVLVEGGNDLEVELAAPVTAAEALDAGPGARPHVNPHPFNTLRKTASNFGWDWGVDVATVGIWKELRLESWSGVRLAGVRPLAGVDGEDGVLTTHVDLAWEPGRGDAGGDDDAVEVGVEVGGVRESLAVTAGQGSAVVTSRVPSAPLWWPRGHGEAVLHDVAVALTGPGGSALGAWEGRVGFRTVTLDTAPDEHGTPFVLAVNGEPVFVRGANWIPDDALMTRLDAGTYRAGILDAVEAGMNLLRVWGGGTYESEHLYAVCDELGVMVWQDFLFACAAYSEDEPLRSEVEAEAREAVARLSQHASLVLWNGCNENIWGYVEWGWRAPLSGRSWGAGYYFELLPAIVAELDPRTPYSPGSPFSYDSFIHPNDPRHGTTHIWDVWNEVDYSTYRDYRSRFVSEFGFQGPPAWSTLTSVVHDEPLDPYGPQMLVHQKADDGNGKLERGLGEHLPRWRDVEEWHWATQLNQARAIAFGVEHFRSLFPLNTGTVVWQLNDDWPVVSWAAVDSHGIRKPLWFALRRVFADRLLTVQPRGGAPALVAHNDSALAWSARLIATRLRTDGSGVLAREVVDLEVAPRSAATVALPAAVAALGDPALEVVRVGADDGGASQERAGDPAAAWWYGVEDPRLALTAPAGALDVTTERTEGGVTVLVRASALVKDLSLFPDRLHAGARVDSGMVTLAPGESHAFVVTCPPGVVLDEEALRSAPVLRSANDLVT